MPKAIKSTTVNWQDFIAAWEACDSADQVAEKTGLSKTTVVVRGAKLRRMGVPIKQYPRKKPASLTVADALAILGKVRGKKVVAVTTKNKRKKAG
jgi:hypothetical protein